MNTLDFINAGKFISQGRGRKHPQRIIDSTELIYVISGNLEMFAGEGSYRVSQGEYLYLHPGVLHGGTRVYPENLIFFWVHFNNKNAVFNDFGKVRYPEKMSALFDMLLSEQSERNDPNVCNSLLELLIYETNFCQESTVIRKEENPLAVSARRLLKLRYTDNLSISLIADMLGCNADYLGRVYHKVWGISILDDLNKIRLKHAASQIRESSCSIKEIAYACGFNDLAYFRRRFFREYSMRPGEYRKLYAANHINTD